MNLEKCDLCPHMCGVNRKNGQVGRCKTTQLRVALYSMHKFEEPCISGISGSGTVFFSRCNLNCKFCQNYKITTEDRGNILSVEELSLIFVELQEKGAHNINLVSPTIYVKPIKEALILAKSKGLKIPIIYNTSGYERVEILKELEGIIDVYLPDFKYYSNEIAYEYSKIKNYFEYASKAVKEMYRQVGPPKLDKNGIIQKGLIIRHLILPNNTDDSIKVLRWIKENLGNEVYVSIMAQYFPTYLALEDVRISRKITKEELEIVYNELEKLELYNGYIQELGEHEEEYVPDFE